MIKMGIETLYTSVFLALVLIIFIVIFICMASKLKNRNKHTIQRARISRVTVIADNDHLASAAHTNLAYDDLPPSYETAINMDYYSAPTEHNMATTATNTTIQTSASNTAIPTIESNNCHIDNNNTREAEPISTDETRDMTSTTVVSTNTLQPSPNGSTQSVGISNTEQQFNRMNSLPSDLPPKYEDVIRTAMAIYI